MKNKILILSLLFSLLGIGMAEAKRVRVVAHRGYWKCEGSSRNSISALNNALAIGAYGTEFDVHMTVDGVPVVHHDATTENGLHIEKISFAELREKGPRLSNGEEIPTLEAYLKAWNHHKRTKLIFELKPQSTPEFETRMVEVCLEMVRRHGIKDNEVEYISFSYHICKELMRLHPSATVLPLSTVEAEPEQMFQDGMAGFDLHYTLLRDHPEWIELAKSQKKIVNVWTINEEELMREMIDLGVDYITTDEPLLLQKVLKERRR